MRHKSQVETGDRSGGRHSTGTFGPNHKFMQDVRNTGYSQVGASLSLGAINGVNLQITSHGAGKGDLIRFTSGDAVGLEVAVFSVTDANNLVLADDFTDDVTAPTATDTLVLLRPTSVVLSSTGASAAAISFTRNGSSQEVIEDTVTPANNRPLPVKLVDVTGDINITAGDLNVSLDSANDSVECIQTTHDDLNANANMQVGNVDVANGNPVPISDAGGAITIDNSAIDTNLDAALSTRASETTLDAVKTATETLAGAVTGTEVQVDIITSALPAGAATEAKQDTLITAAQAIQTAVELIDNAIQGSEMQVDVVTSALPSGAATSANQTSIITELQSIVTAVELIDNAISGSEMQVDVVAPLPSGTNNIGSITKAPTAGTIKSATVTVGTTAVRLTEDGSAPSATRSFLQAMPDPDSAARFWVGDSAVSSSGANRGTELFAGATFERNDDAGDYFIISDTAGQSVHVLEQE